MRDEIQTDSKTDIPITIRSNQTIDRKKAEARAEKELAARKREDARRAKDEVKSFFVDYKKIIVVSLGKNQAKRRGEHG